VRRERLRKEHKIVFSYDLGKRQWASVPSLPEVPRRLPFSTLHHMFNAAIQWRGRAILFGGVLTGIDNRSWHINEPFDFVLRAEVGSGKSWEVRRELVGGMAHCSSLPLRGLFYCYICATGYVKVAPRFVSIDPETLAVAELPEPGAGRELWSHTSLVVDRAREGVLLVGGRTHDSKTSGAMRFFSLQRRQWLEVPEQYPELVEGEPS
jgi:hypothetical protein